jgi:hypothetical protein
VVLELRVVVLELLLMFFSLCNGSQLIRNMILVRAVETYAQNMLRHLCFVDIVLPDSKGSV